MTKLSVNLNKIALIRNSRDSNMPDLMKVAIDCESYGAQGITIHPRPDQRHAKYSDVEKLKEIVTTELNIEGYPSEEFMKVVLKHRPHQVTLVPDLPGALTSDHGWDTILQKDFLVDIINRLKDRGIRTSIFLDANPALIKSAKETGTDRIELYTGPFAEDFEVGEHDSAVKPYVDTAIEALKMDLGINAGHDLNLYNLRFFKTAVPGLLEVSIGHALICDALYLGLEKSIKAYLDRLV
ncbi:MAG: pyridoxine 5'-phosphate synthase [Saprospiraceae bacterium]